MKRIKDRMLLGVICGITSGLVKDAIGRGAMMLKQSELDGPERAAGMLVPAHKICTPKGRIVGWSGDIAIAGILGVVSVYALSLSGKQGAIFKGALAGQAAWTGLYGVLATMGTTTVKTVSPKTVISEFVSHTVY